VTTRDYFLDCLRAKLGDHRKGSPEVLKLWKAVVEPGKYTPAQVEQLAENEDWCGVLQLAGLREAKLTDRYWKLGSGFVLALLGAGAATKTPEPGDLAIIQRWPGATKDAWHHFTVESWAGPNDWWSIDGNSPGCIRKHHDRVLPTTTFYSIAKILPAMPEAGFVRGQEFSVPGVQDGGGES
jgi:hypothetical protein